MQSERSAAGKHAGGSDESVKTVGNGKQFSSFKTGCSGDGSVADTSNSKCPQCSGVVYNIFSSCIILLSSSFILSVSSFSLSHFIYQDPKRLLKLALILESSYLNVSV